MKVKTRIVFEVEYSMNMEFYNTEDEGVALDIEREYVKDGPVTIVELFAEMGTFTTSVEKVNVRFNGNNIN